MTQISPSIVNPRRAGRSLGRLLLAIVALVVVLGGVALLGAYLHYRQMRLAMPAIDATGQFIMLVGSGNIAAARGMTTDAIDEARLTETFEQVEAWGPLRDVNKYHGGEVHASDDIEVHALIEFDGPDKVFVGHWTIIDGNPRLRDYAFRDAPVEEGAATQPQ